MGTHVEILNPLPPGVKQKLMSEEEMVATDPLNAELSAMSEQEIVAYFAKYGFCQSGDALSKLVNNLPFLVLVHLAVGRISKGDLNA